MIVAVLQIAVVIHAVALAITHVIVIAVVNCRFNHYIPMRKSREFIMNSLFSYIPTYTHIFT